MLLGHAFGRALSKMVATDHPELVAAVLLAAAQASRVPPDIVTTPFVLRQYPAPQNMRHRLLRPSRTAMRKRVDAGNLRRARPVRAVSLSAGVAR